MSERVVVVTGAGGMGIAIARRLSADATVLLADVNERALEDAARTLAVDGVEVRTVPTDVSNRASVTALADAAAAFGRVEVLAHTAGVSPVHATAEQILKVDLLGTALLLEVFADVIADGGAGICIASMGGTLANAFTPMSADDERALANVPADDLLALSVLASAEEVGPGLTYAVAKRANQVRVRAAARLWGARGARLNSISPGVIATPMGEAELAGPMGEAMQAMLAGAAVKRVGTAEDIADAVAFLASPQASYITGTDLLVDGGVVAGMLG